MIITEENDLLLIESELEYNNYIAQKELLDEFAALAIKVTESSSHIILEADIKNAISEYIRKVINNVQVAWNKFKRKITESIWKKIEKRYEKELTMDRNIVVDKANDNDVIVNWEAINTFLTQDFHFIVTKDTKDLDETEIIRQMNYFSSIKKFGKKEMQEIVASKCFSPIKQGKVIDLQLITTYKNNLDEIEKKMQPIEKSVKFFNDMESKLLKQVNGDSKEVYMQRTNTGNAQNNSTAQEAYNIILNKAMDYMYLSELSTNDQEDPDGDSTVKGGGGELQKSIMKLTKVVTTYLSVEMWVVNRAVNKSMTVVLSYVRNAAKYNPDRKAPEKKKEETNNIETK